MLRKAFRWLASLWLAVAILALIAGILFTANWLSGYDVSLGALRRDWYGSLWFLPLLGLLMVNLTACTIKRRPWKFWQWGFLITHSGILTLMVGAGISFQYKIYGDMRIQEGKTATEFDIENERELVVRLNGSERRVALDASPYVRSKPNEVHFLSGGAALRVEEFVPSVADEEVFESAPDGGHDVVEVRADAPDGPAMTFFVRSNAMIGNGFLNFTYVVDQPGLFKNLAMAAGPQGTLSLTFDGETKELDVAASIDKPVEIAGRRVTVKKFFSTFVIGENMQPTDDGGRGDDFPAVGFEVEEKGKSETYYAFALDPSLSPMKRGGRGHGAAPPGFGAEFRYAPRKSLVWFFLEAGTWNYVVTSKTGKCASGALAIGEKILHPFTPMKLTFGVVKHLPHAIAGVREEAPKKGLPALPAVKLRWLGSAGAGDAPPFWLKLGESIEAAPAGSRGSVAFQPKAYSDLGLEVTLLKFRNPPYEGVGRASKFESDLRISDRRTGDSKVGTTGVNYPLGFRSWLFYQSAFNDEVRPVMSILQVAYDPGKRVLYLGFIMAASGTIFMFFLKQHLITLVQAAKKAGDPPMGGVEPLVWLSIGCGGTIAFMVAMLTLEGLHPLWMGFLVCVVNVLMGFALAGFANKRSATRPGWALQLGHVISASWCINTAAFVTYMVIRVPA